MTCESTDLAIGDLGQRIDIVLRQGTDAERITLQLQNPDGTFVSFAGATILAQVRRNPEDASPVESFVVSQSAGNDTVYLDFPGSKSTGMAAGINANDATGRYVWDCVATFLSGPVRALAYGDLRIIRSRSRP